MNIKENAKSNFILLVGFPRSGTTWFSNLLNAHSEVCYRHELIGRNHYFFGDRLFGALKQNNGLSDEDYLSVTEVVRKAYFESDKPPFFPKKYGFHKFPKFHYLCWLITRFLPLIQPLYNRLFRLNENQKWRVLLKETRSLQDMESIAKGLRINQLLFLVRIPHGSILSHINGVKNGTMQALTIDQKKLIRSEMKESKFLAPYASEGDDSKDFSDAAYYAARWTLYHERALSLKEVFPNSTMCFYDKFVEDPSGYSKSLISKLGLGYDSAIEEFIHVSSGSEKVTLKDASDEYYSVYRKNTFDKDAWKNQLSIEEIEIIDKLSMPLYNMLNDIYKNDLISENKTR